jgi:hypothetical protein
MSHLKPRPGNVHMARNPKPKEESKKGKKKKEGEDSESIMEEPYNLEELVDEMDVIEKYDL